MMIFFGQMDKLEVKLTPAFAQKSVQLLDRLAEHLRATVPHIVERLEYSINGGWGQTRTWVLGGVGPDV